MKKLIGKKNNHGKMLWFISRQSKDGKTLWLIEEDLNNVTFSQNISEAISFDKQFEAADFFSKHSFLFHEAKLTSLYNYQIVKIALVG